MIAAHPKEVERYRSGQTGVLGFLMAQVMKQGVQGRGEAQPQASECVADRGIGLNLGHLSVEANAKCASNLQHGCKAGIAVLA